MRVYDKTRHPRAKTRASLFFPLISVMALLGLDPRINTAI
jgi:hypothetical protein